MFSSEAWLAKSGGFYNGVITSSCRFNGSTSKLVSPAFSSDLGNTWTWSAWVKFTNQTSDRRGSLFNPVGESASLYFDNTSQDFLSVNDDGAVVCNTSRLLRDSSSWYHICLNGNGTINYLWINGVLATFGTNPNVDGINIAVAHQIGGSTFGANYFFDGIMADINFVSETALDYTAFAETKNGVLIPKEPSVTYGANGFRLQFKQTGSGADASGIGADTSGNNKHFTATGLDAYDVLPDSPENNFCTLNSVGRRYGHSYSGTFSEGNLKFASSGNASMAFGTMAINQIASQGGVYFEVRMDSIDVNRTYFGVIGDNGANNKSAESNGASYSFPIKGLMNNDPRGLFSTDTDGTSLNLTANTAFSNGDVAGIAILSDGKFFCHRNGTYLQNADGNVGNPSTGANPIATIDLTLGDWVAHVGYNSTLSVNFGQDGSFQSNETSGGNQDGNAIGDFMFAVPTNCFAICSSNMAEPTISPNADTQADDYFNTVLYSGNGGTQNITGFGFQPDWIWDKSRNQSGSHMLVDSSRGVGKYLRTNVTSAEVDDASILTHFISDGVTVGDINGNASSSSAVMWGWKANGSTTSSNSDGSITSTVQANTTAGFSIVTFTGNNTNDATIGHGLGTTPAMIITKNRDDSVHWRVWHKDLQSTYVIYLSSSLYSFGPSSHSNGYIKTVGSSTYSTYQANVDSNGVNGASDAMVAYCFAEVEGYSKIGSYVGNGVTSGDGTFAFLGFLPAFIMIKNTTASAEWIMVDSVRSTFNEVDDILVAEDTSKEADFGTTNRNIDFLSNGFKIRSSASGGTTALNTSGSTYIYMAFAEAPFKYANGR